MSEEDKLFGLIMDGKVSDFDVACQMAMMHAEKAIKDTEFMRHLHNLKMEYLHEKGWSKKGNLKSKYELPENVFLSLPHELRSDHKLLHRWLDSNVPVFNLAK